MKDMRTENRTVARVDGSVEVEAKTLLRQSPYREVRRVSCELRDGVLTLTGRIPSYFLKQMAQHTLQHRFTQDLAIENRLEVGL